MSTKGSLFPGTPNWYTCSQKAESNIEIPKHDTSMGKFGCFDSCDPRKQYFRPWCRAPGSISAIHRGDPRAQERGQIWDAQVPIRAVIRGRLIQENILEAQFVEKSQVLGLREWSAEDAWRYKINSVKYRIDEKELKSARMPIQWQSNLCYAFFPFNWLPVVPVLTME